MKRLALSLTLAALTLGAGTAGANPRVLATFAAIPAPAGSVIPPAVPRALIAFAQQRGAINEAVGDCALVKPALYSCDLTMYGPASCGDAWCRTAAYGVFVSVQANCGARFSHPLYATVWNPFPA